MKEDNKREQVFIPIPVFEKIQEVLLDELSKYSHPSINPMSDLTDEEVGRMLSILKKRKND